MEAQLLPCLQQTLNPVTARRAEQALRSAECQSGFAISLLKLVASSNVDNSSRQAAALFFKNFIKRAWKDDEGDNRIPAADCAAVKSEIIGLMISLPPILQVQLGEAVTIIADSDFPENWPELMDDLVSRLSPDDMVVNNGVLQTAHSIFKRWRSQFRSDVLFTEIKFVLDRFCNPFFDLLKRVDELIEQNARNAAALRVLLQTLFLISKISFDLNCQDLPEFFEDNLTLIFGTFHKYLTYTNPLMETDDDEETGPIEKVKASILELVDLYTMRFEEDFSMLPEFANTTWTLLTSTGLEMKHDIASSFINED
ncbi:Importin alpha re-exporter [Neolecta irregularis DAH-3]|uniref:Importin alpha re-exporter n=1 Tax=Neolecta irregularis (strain DAH-3) TaxID=1198029 RepID=A0A1U7LUN7_NEOID|nr:Importin alpha re-exporter [Neolecta irregularis DAH-3]|eukprot:OLL26293.1 Importin alpha re-exporter [Neolecta irregularis DAH-3]